MSANFSHHYLMDDDVFQNLPLILILILSCIYIKNKILHILPLAVTKEHLYSGLFPGLYFRLMITNFPVVFSINYT